MCFPVLSLNVVQCPACSQSEAYLLLSFFIKRVQFVVLVPSASCSCLFSFVSFHFLSVAQYLVASVFGCLHLWLVVGVVCRTPYSSSRSSNLSKFGLDSQCQIVPRSPDLSICLRIWHLDRNYFVDIVDTVVKKNAIQEGFGRSLIQLDGCKDLQKQADCLQETLFANLSRCAEPLKQRLTWPKRRQDGFGVQRSMYLSSTQGFDRAFSYLFLDFNKIPQTL